MIERSRATHGLVSSPPTIFLRMSLREPVLAIWPAVDRLSPSSLIPSSSALSPSQFVYTVSRFRPISVNYYQFSYILAIARGQLRTKLKPNQCLPLSLSLTPLSRPVIRTRHAHLLVMFVLSSSYFRLDYKASQCHGGTGTCDSTAPSSHSEIS